MAAIASNTFPLNPEVSESIQRFQPDILIKVLDGFMGYSVPSPASSETSFEAVKGTICSTARLDAYVATVITCLQADGSENVGEYRQKLYNDTISSFLYVAFGRLVHQIGAYVER